MVQAETSEKEMMPPDYIGMYLATMILVGFFGSFLIETVDRKSDEMAGFRQRQPRRNKR